MQSNMSKSLSVARKRYVPTTLEHGIPSCDCGDYTAQLLRGMPLEQVLTLADEIKGLPHGTHAKKYAHLNNGAARMNAGNIIRRSRK